LRALNHRITIGVELAVLEMSVSVDEHGRQMLNAER
jgi:hypothetical protein